MNWLPTFNEILLAVLIIAWVGIVIISSELLRAKGIMSTYSSRKIVHIAIIVPIILAYTMVDRSLYPIIITGIAFLFNYFTAPVSPIKSFRLKVFSEGHKWGTVLFSFSVFLIFLFWYYQPAIGLIAGSALCFGDGFSGMIGKKYGKIRPSFLKGKSIEGSIVFFLTSLIGSVLLFLIVGVQVNQSLLVITIISLLVATVTEVFSPGGYDNVIVPIITGFTAQLLFIVF